MNIHFDFLSEILSASEVDENIENIYCSFKKINNEIYFVIKVSGKLPDLTYFEKETMYFIEKTNLLYLLFNSRVESFEQFATPPKKISLDKTIVDESY